MSKKTERLRHLMGELQPGEKSDPDDLTQQEVEVDAQIAHFQELLPKVIDHIYSASLGQNLVQLIRAVKGLYLTVDEEHSEDDHVEPELIYHLTSSDGRRKAQSSDLLVALCLMLGKSPRKRCKKCNKVKLLTEFSRRKDTRDFRNTSCRACENLRVSAARKVKMEAKSRLLSAGREVLQTRRCRGACRQEKLISDFARDKGGYRKVCKECRARAERERGAT